MATKNGLIASAGAQDKIKAAIQKYFFMEEPPDLKETDSGVFSICRPAYSAKAGQPFAGVIVRLVKGRYRFERVS